MEVLFYIEEVEEGWFGLERNAVSKILCRHYCETFKKSNSSNVTRFVHIMFHSMYI